MDDTRVRRLSSSFFFLFNYYANISKFFAEKRRRQSRRISCERITPLGVGSTVILSQRNQRVMSIS